MKVEVKETPASTVSVVCAEKGFHCDRIGVTFRLGDAKVTWWHEHKIEAHEEPPSPDQFKLSLVTAYNSCADWLKLNTKRIPPNLVPPITKGELVIDSTSVLATLRVDYYNYMCRLAALEASYEFRLTRVHLASIFAEIATAIGANTSQ